MKKINKVKMGPLGNPLGNPLGFFNSQKAKRSAEPKQTLRKANNGVVVDAGYEAYKKQQEAAANKKRDTEFTPGQQFKTMGSGTTQIPYDVWQLGAKSPMNKYYKENPKEKNNPERQYYTSDEYGTSKAPDPNNNFGYFSDDDQKYMDAYSAQEDFNYTLPEKLQNLMPYKKGGATKVKKFAALAPPFNKATAADRIVGAKKNARKKK
jgi:hypothetical protein